MENNFVLLQNTDTQNERAHKPLQLKLELSTPSRNEIDVTRCPTVYEDGHYFMQVQIKLAEIEQELKNNQSNNQRQNKLYKNTSEQLTGTELARQDMFGQTASSHDRDVFSDECERETESLYLNKQRTQKDRKLKYTYVPAKYTYIQSKLGTTYSGNQWRTQGIALANPSRHNTFAADNAKANPAQAAQATQAAQAAAAAEADLLDKDFDDDILHLGDEEDHSASRLRLYEDQFKRLTSVTIELNNQAAGHCEITNQGSGNYLTKAIFEQRNGMVSNQPFLLYYDVMVLSFRLNFEDGYSLKLYAPPLLCASLNSNEAVNINQILFELTNLENNRLLDMMFKRGQTTSKQISKDDWMNFEENRSYQSLSEYSFLVEQIIRCYTDNFGYFKTQAKHSLTKWQKIVPFNQVKQVSSKNFNWLTQHLEELTQVDPSMAVLRYQDKNYQPLHMQTESVRKSYATYENQVVIGFLHLVLHNANKIASEYQAFISQQREQLNQGTQLSHGSYQAPIITMKLIQLERCEQELQKLYSNLSALSNLYLNYQNIFKLPPSFLKTFPRKSKIFQELKPYAEVFMSIWRFFQFGSFHLDKDRMLFEVTTLDRLFEYYCLYRLLEMLVQQGFKPIPHGNRIFDYSIMSTQSLNHAQTDAVANTYILRRGEQQAVLYYQPVIYSKCFENGIRAYRTTQTRYPKSLKCGDFYTPDFILKFRNSNAERYQEEYLIFDAKFAQTNTILQYYINELTRKYGFETSIAVLEPFQKSLREDRLANAQELSDHDSHQLPSYDNDGGDDPFDASLFGSLDEGESIGDLICKENKREYKFVGSKPPKMIFALQGRINFTQNAKQTFAASTTERRMQGADSSGRKYNGLRMHSVRNMLMVHNSDLAKYCPPPTSVGLVEFNTQVNSTPALWNEIVHNIPYLANDPRSEQEKQEDAKLNEQMVSSMLTEDELAGEDETSSGAEAI